MPGSLYDPILFRSTTTLQGTTINAGSMLLIDLPASSTYSPDGVTPRAHPHLKGYVEDIRLFLNDSNTKHDVDVVFFRQTGGAFSHLIDFESFVTANFITIPGSTGTFGAKSGLDLLYRDGGAGSIFHIGIICQSGTIAVNTLEVELSWRADRGE